ncbi:MAG TPA: malate synthase A [Bdellovibrionota bacterium]|nr:malate synthase A [Bdellovibrionota bacterium]
MSPRLAFIEPDLSPSPQALADLLTDEAQEFLTELDARFEPRRQELLRQRELRREEIRSGRRRLDFLRETEPIRRADWSVASAPADLRKRNVEITGPVDRKMMINALNSGADCFMADFEDSLSPTWRNVIEGQKNVRDAARRELELVTADGKRYRLADRTATLLVRPRGWHLNEQHALVGDRPASASLFDFGLFFFHCARELIERGTGPYLYLPKMESHHEARLWNDVFVYAQDALRIPRGTIRATALIETIPAAFEMDEILFELRDHASGLNAGRWDYLFSVIKELHHDRHLKLPDRAQLTMNVPFMRAYATLLVSTCHHRGAYAIGGMAAFVPSRADAEASRAAIAKVTDDKLREASQGFDGTWVAHPDLVPVARKAFDEVLHGANDQRHRALEPSAVGLHDLTDFRIAGGKVTESGVIDNIDVAVRYLDSWISGTGAVAIRNLMEDVATAEIARSQLWHWVHTRTRLEDGRALDSARFDQLLARAVDGIPPQAAPRRAEAAQLLRDLALAERFPDFLTLEAYPLLGIASGAAKAGVREAAQEPSMEKGEAA